MKTIKYIIALLAAIPFLSSCDDHIYEDASWHAWRPGMVYCTNGEVMSYEDCAKRGNTPEAVLFYVDNQGVISGKAYAVSLKNYSEKEFIDPDTIYFEQGTSADIEKFDGEENTIVLRYFQIASPIAKNVTPKFFIPSVAEMYKLYLAKSIVNGTIERCGGDLLPIDKEDCWYWTSTEVAGAAQDRAWRYSLTSGRFEAADKHSQYATRPIMSIRLNKEE